MIRISAMQVISNFFYKARDESDIVIDKNPCVENQDRIREYG